MGGLAKTSPLMEALACPHPLGDAWSTTLCKAARRGKFAPKPSTTSEMRRMKKGKLLRQPTMEGTKPETIPFLVQFTNPRLSHEPWVPWASHWLSLSWSAARGLHWKSKTWETSVVYGKAMASCPCNASLGYELVPGQLDPWCLTHPNQ